MNITFLGTNGWYDTATGNTLSILIETQKEYVVFDAGNGIYKLDKYVTKNKPVLLFLSHLHLDHIAGLHIIDKFNFKQGMKVYYPNGMRRYIASIVRKPFTAPMKRLKTKIEFAELTPGLRLPLKCTYKKLKHPVTCYGYRLEADGQSAAFCTDTGRCNNMLALSKNADILISECSYLPGEVHNHWPHLNPETAAGIAKEAHVRRLALVHFDASRYINLSDRKLARKKAQKIFQNTFVPRDGQTITL